MTNRERQLLQLIEQNPMIKQKDLAEKLGITRSSVAVHIRNLMLKGYIKGKGYVLDDNIYVAVIGATNFDVQGFSNTEVSCGGFNFGQVKESAGGVGRNITENLIRLGTRVKFVSCIGGDGRSHFIMDHCHKVGISTDDFLVVENGRASTYMAILDEKKHQVHAFADMKVLEEMTPEFINSKSQILRNAKIISLDTGFDDGVIDYIFQNYKRKDIYMSPISTDVHQITEHLNQIHTLRINAREAGLILGRELKTRKDIIAGGKELIEKGIRRVYITHAGKGVYFNDSRAKLDGYIKTNMLVSKSISGTADAFMAGIIFGTIKDMKPELLAKFAIAMADSTAKSRESVNPLLTYDFVMDTLKETNL
jgi:pseudouridine kinase